MKLTRREFVIAGTLSGAAVLLPASAGAESGNGGARYVHAEVGSGAWTRDALESLAGDLVVRFSFSPTHTSCLGSDGRFVLTVECEQEARIVVRTVNEARDGVLLTIRYRDGSAEESHIEYPLRPA